MELIVIAIGMININTYILIIIQILVGIVFYIGASIVFKLDSLEYILDIVKNIVKRKKYNKQNT